MKVKYRLGIKSYSGKADGLVYANFANRGVVIGKMPAVGREPTEHNIMIGERSRKIATLYKEVSDAYKQDLELYTYKMYNLEDYRERIAGNKYSTFCKLIWSAVKDSQDPLDLDSVTTHGITNDNCSQIISVKVAVEKGYLPQVDGYEELTSTIKI